MYRLLDISEQIVKPIMIEDRALTDISIVSGMSGVFSAFKEHVLNAAKRFGIDARDIFMELGRRKVIAGQEDMIVEVAEKLAHPLKEDEESYMLSSLA